MNLYVGNLNFDITEEEIKELFEQVGEVASVRLMYDRETGNSKGYGFVEMNDVEEYVIALKTLNGRILGGRNIVVNQGTADGDGKKPAQNRQQQGRNNSQPNRGYNNQGGSGYNRPQDNYRAQGGNGDRGGYRSQGGADNYNRPPRDNAGYKNREGNNYDNRDNYRPNYSRDNSSYNRDGNRSSSGGYDRPSSGGYDRPNNSGYDRPRNDRNEGAESPRSSSNYPQNDRPAPYENRKLNQSEKIDHNDSQDEKLFNTPDNVDNNEKSSVREEVDQIKPSSSAKRPRARITAPEKVEKKYSKDSSEEATE